MINSFSLIIDLFEMYIDSAISMFYVQIVSFRHSFGKKICGNLGIHDAKLKGFLICWLHTDLIDPVENQRTKLGQ